MKKSNIVAIICLAIAVFVGLSLVSESGDFLSPFGYDNEFNIISNEDNSLFDDELYAFARSNKINLRITHADDLEAIDLIEANSSNYDALWLSNSTWIYMLDKAKTLNSKSTNINPVVFGIKKSKAEELGFVNKEIKNKDIVNAIKNGKLKYVMSSVTKTNTGLIAYLGFLNSLSGSPEILRSDMLKSAKLENDLISLFSGVQRVSGDDNFLNTMFLNSDEYEAVIATESSLININKKLTSLGKEPLYLIYPSDGVAINDSPFAYIDNSQDKLDDFNKLQSFILSSESQKKMESMGKRTWYGGIKENADSSSFKKEWGIDTTKYLIPLKYPSKDVIEESIALYIDKFRKPSVTVFCLDYSGSMFGNGEKELESAMEYILDYEMAKSHRIQFSDKDKIYVIPFGSEVQRILVSDSGRNTRKLIYDIKKFSPNGGTNLYGCSIKALETLKNESNDYTKTIVLMTDGEGNVGSFSELENVYYSSEKIPIYSIMFASAKERQLKEIAELTNAKIFDGRTNLTEAFKEVRSYN